MARLQSLYKCDYRWPKDQTFVPNSKEPVNDCRIKIPKPKQVPRCQPGTRPRIPPKQIACVDCKPLAKSCGPCLKSAKKTTDEWQIGDIEEKVRVVKCQKAVSFSEESNKDVCKKENEEEEEKLPLVKCEKYKKDEVKKSENADDGKIELGETDDFLRQLFEKNPELYSMVRKKLTKDDIQKFNQERYKTSYQLDFGRIAFDPNDFYRNGSLPKEPFPLDLISPPVQMDCRKDLYRRVNILRAARRANRESEICCDVGRAKSTEAQDRPLIVPKRKKPAFDSEDAPLFARGKATAWITEYREIVGETGDDIMTRSRRNARKNNGRKRSAKPRITPRKAQNRPSKEDCRLEFTLG